MFDLELKLLRGLTRFKDVDTPTLKLLAMAGEREHFDGGEALITEGAAADAVYILMAGAVDVTRLIDGEPTRIGTMEPGAIVGEVGVLLSQPRFATLTAREPVTALRLDGSVYLDLVQQLPPLAMSTIRELAGRLVEVSERYTELKAHGSDPADDHGG